MTEVKKGSLVEFIGYEGGEVNGNLVAGDILEVVKVIPADNVEDYNYTVLKQGTKKSKENPEENLFNTEFKLFIKADKAGKKAIKAGKKEAAVAEEKPAKEKAPVKVAKEKVPAKIVEGISEAGTKVAVVDNVFHAEVTAKTIDEAIKGAISIGNKEVHNLAKRLIKLHDASFLALAKVADYIQEKELFAQLKNSKGELFSNDIDGFKQYCEEVLNYSYSTLKRQVQIYKHFCENLGVSEAKMLKLGWSKASELLSIANDKNVAKLIDDALDMSKNEIKEMKEKRYGEKLGGETVNMVRKVLHLTEVQAETFNDVLNKMRVGDNAEASDETLIFNILCEYNSQVLGNDQSFEGTDDTQPDLLKQSA